MTSLRALTIHQPYAWAIAAGLKPVENRTWMTYHQGPIAIHAGVGAGPKWQFQNAVEHVADLTGRTVQDVIKACQVRGAVVAVATLTEVCSEARYRAWSVRDACECGPWSVGRSLHFRLADVRALPEPVPVKGSQQFWDLPDDVDAAVRAQLGAEAATHA